MCHDIAEDVLGRDAQPEALPAARVAGGWVVTASCVAWTRYHVEAGRGRGCQAVPRWLGAYSLLPAVSIAKPVNAATPCAAVRWSCR